jgi:hypothetical protein
MIIHGWGRYPEIDANLFFPKSKFECFDYIKKNSVCLDEFYFHIVFKEIIGNLHNNCLFMKKIVIPKLPLIKRDETKIKLFFIDLFQYLYQGKIFLTPIVEISFLDKNDDLSCYNEYILKRVL